ncbi:MAG: hypothetical protein AAF492_10990 [Verrucomicrobiota bacterium]
MMATSIAQKPASNLLDRLIQYELEHGLIPLPDISLQKDRKKPLGVHLNKSFLETGPVGLPANLSYTKNEGQDSVFNYDAAFRLELGDFEEALFPNTRMTPYVGAEFHRQEGKDGNDSRQYFAVLSLTSAAENFDQTDPQLLAGFAYVDDVVNDSSGWTWIFEFRPWKAKEEKHVRANIPGDKNRRNDDILKKDRVIVDPLLRAATFVKHEQGNLYGLPFDLQFIPMLAIEGLTADPENPIAARDLANEEARTLLREALEDKLDNQFFRYGFQLKMGLFKRIEITYDLNQRHVIDDWSEDYLYQEVNLTFKLGPDELEDIKGLSAVPAGLALNATYSDGADLPTLNDVQQWRVGLGVKF